MADEKSPTVSSLPSGEPIRSSPDSKPTYKASLAAMPSNADAFLSHLHRVVQTRAGTDITLLWLTYASHLSSDVLTLLANPVSTLPAAALSNPLVRSFLAITGLILRPGSLPSALALQLAARLKALALTLSEVRIFGRLWGLLGIYFGAKAAAEKRRALAAADPKAASHPEARFDVLLSHAQLAALISYQSLENISYLSSRKILPLSPHLQQRFGKWSVRSWMVYIGMELGKLLVERARRVPKRAYDAESVREEKEWRAEWQKNFLRTAAWAPLTVNWSLEQPVLPSLATAALAFYPCMGMMKDMWQAKAQA